MNKILNNHKVQMDVINDSMERADFERKQALEDRATEADVEFMLEENNKLVDGDYKEIDSGI